MFGFGKNKTPENPAEDNTEKPEGLFARLRNGLARTRANLSDALGDLLCIGDHSGLVETDTAVHFGGRAGTTDDAVRR